MINNKLFGGSLPMMKQALDLRMEKQGLVQSNIANKDTPGYKVRDIPFKEALAEATENQNQVTLDHTDPGHMGSPGMQPGSFVVVEDREVDLDEEMMKLSKNQLMYQIGTSLVAKKLSGLETAIDEGGQ
ncbi:MAG: flagellar basal body rod protein FlgB [Desulfurivibrionaceae bacterium]